MIYWAHSDRDGLAQDDPNSHWQLLAEHLRNVGSLARALAKLAAPADKHFQDLAERSGFLHDFGKYSECFQNLIRGAKSRCPHAIHGAAIAYQASGLRAPHIAHAIAGHHAGMPDRTVGLQEKVGKFQDEANRLRAVAVMDSPELARLLNSVRPELEPIDRANFDLYTRMLFSCLVDADRLDSAGRPPMQTPLYASTKLAALLHRIVQLPAAATSPVVNAARQEVLDDCLAAASWPERLLSLSVPTGGGKTLAAMAFALKRASLQPEAYRRIIVVIPYLSIIEQNAQVYSDIFGEGAILEHHSGSFEKLRTAEDGGETAHYLPQSDESEPYLGALRPETENWDAPLIVTTSVRFFESLFSNHPSDLRRVHNIARSIVILDEVQVLPRSLLAPLLAMIHELTSRWGCTFVLSTATRPAFERSAGSRDARWPTGTVREIVRAPAELYRRLKRVSIDWRIQKAVAWPQVAEWIAANERALCVVNTRSHAATLYRQMLALRGASALYHLSTRMCAAHRLQVIGEMRRRLAAREPCLVISTQLIEAGVDVDFPIVFRALGPLDSIIQTAGRADREGRLTALSGHPAGRVIVFLPEDHRMPPNEYQEAEAKTRSLASQRDIQCDDREAMEMFFQRYYGEHADLGDALNDLRLSAKFKTLADQFEMISTRTLDVFVPFGDGKRAIDELGKIGKLTAGLRQKLQRYIVGLLPWEFEAARNVLWEVRPDSNLWVASEAAYSQVMGLELSIEPAALIS